jgi:hypothetical protein
MKMLDWKKPIQTKNGDKATLVYTKKGAEQEYPQVVILHFDDEDESVEEYTLDGKYHAWKESENHDLINIPEEKTCYINFYSNGSGNIWRNRKLATTYSDDTIIASVKVTYKEGQYDD